MRFSKWVLWALLAVLTLSPAAAQEEAMTPATPEVYITGAWARATALPEMMDMDHGDMGGETESMDTSNGDEAATPEGHDMGGMVHTPTASDNGVSAAYMTIENAGDTPVWLVSALTPYSGLVEIHETRMQDDIMQMRPVEGGIEVPAGGMAELKPRGYHIMMMDLYMPLVAGSAMSLTLTFAYMDADNQEQTFDVIIGAPILQEMPEAPVLDVLALNAWARPTAPAMVMPANKVDLTDEVKPDTPDTTDMDAATDNGDAGSEGEMGDGEMGDMMQHNMGAAGGVSAAYMMLFNRTDAALKIVSAESPAAAEVQIHETTVENDMAMMRELEAGLDLPAGERVELKPGGTHIMLLDLVAPIAPGQAVMITLTFETGETLTLAVPVYDKGEMEMMR